MPASTFRAWFIGTIFVVAGCVDPAEPTVLLAPIYRLAVSQGFRQPVLQHSSAHYYRLRQCPSTTCFSCWKTFGSDPSIQAVHHLRIHLESQPWKVQSQGAHGDHYHGKLHPIHKLRTSHRDFSGAVQRVTGSL